MALNVVRAIRVEPDGLIPPPLLVIVAPKETLVLFRKSESRTVSEPVLAASATPPPAIAPDPLLSTWLNLTTLRSRASAAVPRSAMPPPWTYASLSSMVVSVTFRVAPPAEAL